MLPLESCDIDEESFLSAPTCRDTTSEAPGTFRDKSNPIPLTNKAITEEISSVSDSYAASPTKIAGPIRNCLDAPDQSYAFQPVNCIQFYEIRENIITRKDNLIIFIIQKGGPCDKDACAGRVITTNRKCYPGSRSTNLL